MSTAQKCDTIGVVEKLKHPAVYAVASKFWANTMEAGARALSVACRPPSGETKSTQEGTHVGGAGLETAAGGGICGVSASFLPSAKPAVTSQILGGGGA